MRHSPRTEPGPGATLILRNNDLQVTILPAKGADIYALADRRTGVDVLFKSPWGTRSPGPWPRAATSMERWVEAYPGGWQVLLPNGGDECVEQGVTWGYHGEAALVPWEVTGTGDTWATLETRLFTVPLRIEREFTLDGPVLRLAETVTNESAADLEVMWSHHPAFGAPFLDGGCLLSAGCRSVLADDEAPGTLLAPGSQHAWPHATTAAGDPLDLRRIPGPGEPRAVLAYLGDFTSGYFAITNPRLRLGVGLRWPLDPFGQAWLWQEVHVRRGLALVSAGLRRRGGARRHDPGPRHARRPGPGSARTRFAGGAARQVVLEAVLFEADTAVAGIGEGGRVELA